ncbi:hypothetical protein [Streptacidiphilus sp. P02-A3a]|uniref:hypothetical protein n=1 Tax=Streptacidiphilus sp. P02-A3a TaxID=2704468 RepID=UPI0015FCBB27|nr:hypothetical protein [Streptacidiphilus sp. P02-A3a]QMU68330.1 hypothetical protein GXP74_08900 [Streptacidiphilus sp. P02-A3a]
MSDTDDSTPAVWDPTARGGAGGWVRRGTTARADVPDPARGPSGPAGRGAATAPLPRVPGQAEEPEPTLARPHPTAAPGDGAPSPEQTYRPTSGQTRPPGYVRPRHPRPAPGQPGDAEPRPPVAAEPPAADDRRRLRPALLLLAGVVVVALVGGFAVRGLGGGPAKQPGALAPAPSVTAPGAGATAPPATAGATSTASTGPGTPPSGNPSASAPGGGGDGGDGRAEATAVDQLLGLSSSAGQQMTDAVAQVSQCQNSASVTAAQAALTQAAAARRAMVTRLAALDVSQVAGGAPAVQVLGRAWSESATADTDYARWAGAMAKGGCTADSAPQDSDYADAETQSGLATTDKNAFIDVWTPIAMQYGLPTRTADAI